MKVSVIIPVYNGEKTLRECISSVLAQEYQEFELVVVNNNSADSTQSIIEDFQRRDKRVRCVFEEFRSRGAARNAGVIHSQGEILLMTDADCRVPEHWIRDMIQPIIDEGEEMTMGHEWNMLESYWTSCIHQSNLDFYARQRQGDYIHLVDTKNIAAKREVFEKYPFEKELVQMEDFEFSLKIRDNVKIRYLPEIKVGHYHKSTMLSWMRLSYERGRYVMKVYEFYRGKPVIDEEPMFESIHWQNMLLWPLWFLYQCVKRPSKRLWFIFISEVGWRTGLIRGMIKC